METTTKNEIKSPVTTATEEIEFNGLLTVMPSPHIRSKETTASVMLKVIIALLPAYIWGVWVYGWRALLIGVISIGSAVGFEALAQYLLHRDITVNDLSAVVTGLLLAMNLPVTVPLWMPVVGSAVAIVLVKQLFGGIGRNFMNPALLARVFLMLSWSGKMLYVAPKSALGLSVELNEADIVASATPLASLKSGALPTASLKDMLFGNIGGCIGEVSALLLIVGGIFLLLTKVITWHIPVAYIGTVALITLVFPKGDMGGVDFMLYELLAGGLLIGAFFMATDYSTSPTTPVGRLIFGVGCGLITVLIRYFGSYPEGVSFSILIMNMLVWFIDKATMPRKFGGKKCKTK